MTATVTLRLPEDEHARLRMLAGRQGVSLNTALRRLIADAVAAGTGTGLTPGLGSSGRPDLARRVDESLSDGFGA